MRCSCGFDPWHKNNFEEVANGKKTYLLILSCKEGGNKTIINNNIVIITNNNILYCVFENDTMGKSNISYFQSTPGFSSKIDFKLFGEFLFKSESFNSIY